MGVIILVATAILLAWGSWALCSGTRAYHCASVCAWAVSLLEIFHLQPLQPYCLAPVCPLPWLTWYSQTFHILPVVFAMLILHLMLCHWTRFLRSQPSTLLKTHTTAHHRAFLQMQTACDVVLWWTLLFTSFHLTPRPRATFSVHRVWPRNNACYLYNSEHAFLQGAPLIAFAWWVHGYPAEELTVHTCYIE